MEMCLYQVGMKYDRSYAADTMKDIERQKYILTRFDTFLILPLFSPTVAKRYRCRFYSCKAEYYC